MTQWTKMGKPKGQRVGFGPRSFGCPCKLSTSAVLLSHGLDCAPLPNFTSRLVLVVERVRPRTGHKPTLELKARFKDSPYAGFGLWYLAPNCSNLGAPETRAFED